MKKIYLTMPVLTILLLTLVSPVLPANKPPAKGETLPVFNLPIPKSPAEKGYLGLSGDGLFKIPQIKARVVIVEIYSMYCPYCQKDAPGINEFYQLIEKSSNLKSKIKMIGIGAGNTSFEVEVFKKTYQVPFPLFPDKDFTIHKASGEVRTPYFIVIKINDDGTHQIVHAQLGDYPGAEPFLEIVLKASGLK
ncbi:MAG: TlpA disulfide reductase family protein [Thermodesulfobacteriota bacterium]|nr:TlpA disulfide reductase family protein [Thermodesulfobacteriota bacterium]